MQHPVLLVDAATRYGWWQEREGIDAAHLPAAGDGCVLLEPGRLIPSPREQSADGQHRLGQFYLHEKVWLVPALCPSISARMVLATPRERVM